MSFFKKLGQPEFSKNWRIYGTQATITTRKMKKSLMENFIFFAVNAKIIFFQLILRKNMNRRKDTLTEQHDFRGPQVLHNSKNDSQVDDRQAGRQIGRQAGRLVERSKANKSSKFNNKLKSNFIFNLFLYVSMVIFRASWKIQCYDWPRGLDDMLCTSSYRMSSKI